MRTSTPILIVEDDSVDAAAVERALRDAGAANPLIVVGDGIDALEYLSNRNDARPCVILLDLDLPAMNGNDFLEAVKANDDLRQIPVVMLTASDKREDVDNSFGLGVAGYIVKSPDYQEFVETIRALHQYWSLSELPCRQ